MSGQFHIPTAIALREDAVEETRALVGNRTLAVQYVASQFTDTNFETEMIDYTK
jgi:hypothetical protein